MHEVIMGSSVVRSLLGQPIGQGLIMCLIMRDYAFD
jgi:hypothetical protein